jgi:hypothetical protein
LTKCQDALDAAGRPRLNIGSGTGQTFDVVRCLRNALVQYTPEWEHDFINGALYRDLTNTLKHRENRQPIGEPWFPNKALGDQLSRLYHRTTSTPVTTTATLTRTTLHGAPPVHRRGCFVCWSCLARGIRWATKARRRYRGYLRPKASCCAGAPPAVPTGRRRLHSATFRSFPQRRAGWPAVSSVVCWARDRCTVEVFVGDEFFDGLPP